MEIHTQSDAKNDVALDEEFKTLQTILATQDEAMSYEEAADIGRELLGFFEALGEENVIDEDNDA